MQIAANASGISGTVGDGLFCCGLFCNRQVNQLDRKNILQAWRKNLLKITTEKFGYFYHSKPFWYKSIPLS